MERARAKRGSCKKNRHYKESVTNNQKKTVVTHNQERMLEEYKAHNAH